ncbi:STAS domain-containing protein [Streptomyces sp. NPDC054829]
MTRGEYTYEHVSDDVTVVSVANEYRDLEISVYTAPALRTVLVDLVNQGRYFLVVDLAGIAFIDSTGLGVLVGALKRVRVHGGEVAVAVPTVRIGKVFRITGLASVFAQFDTVDAAVEFLGRQAANAYA